MTRKIAIVASRPHKTKIGSEIIMRGMGTDYSHVTWVFFSRDGRTRFYYEATMGGGVTFTGAKNWDSRNKEVFYYEKQITDDLHCELLELAMSLCGIKYAVLQNVGIKLASIFGYNHNIFPNGEELINCSELVGKFAGLAGFTIKESADMVSPRDIVNHLRGLNGSV